MNDQRYLLDTHILLWILNGDDRLPVKYRSILEERPPQVVSAVSIWEVVIKRALGKLSAPPDLLSVLLQRDVEIIPIMADMHRQSPCCRHIMPIRSTGSSSAKRDMRS